MSIQRLRFSPDGRSLSSAGEDCRVLQWDIHSGAATEVARHGDLVSTVEYSPDGGSIVTAAADGNVRLADRQGRSVREFRDAADRRPFGAAFSPDGTMLLSCWGDGTTRLSDLDGKELASFKASESRASQAAFSPHFAQDGLLVTASNDNRAYLWYRDGRRGPVLQHDMPVSYASFSADGQRVLTAAYDGQVRLWDLEGRQLWSFTGHEGPVHSAEFSWQGDRIVTASRDKTVRILDLDGRERLAIDCRGGFSLHATFSPDGRRVAIAMGGTIWLVPILAEDLLDLAQARAGDFTAQERDRFKDLLPAPAR